MTEDIATKEDLRIALVEGEFKRLVKYDVSLGEHEKKHIMASSERVIKLVEQSIQTSVYDLPPLPVHLCVLTIVSAVFGTVYNYVFATEEDAKASARWYATYAGWTREKEKHKDAVLEEEGSETFLLRIMDIRSGDYALVTNARVHYSPLSQNTRGA